MGTLECPQSGCESGELSESALRRHFCNEHLAYRKFRCPHCARPTHFALLEDARDHSDIESHPRPFSVLEEPNAEKEAQLRRFLGQAFLASLEEPPEKSPPPSPPVARLPSIAARLKRPAVEETSRGLAKPKLETRVPVKQPLVEASEPEDVKPVLGKTCRVCASTSGDRRKHAITHVTDLRALTCRRCPPETAFQTAWYMDKMVAHTSLAHPGLPADVDNQRSKFLPLIEAQIHACYSDAAPPAAADESDVADQAFHADGRLQIQDDPGACRKCGARPAKKGAHLGVHLKSVRAIACRTCPYATFWYPSDLNKHTRSVHPGAKPAYDDDRAAHQGTFDAAYEECWGVSNPARPVAAPDASDASDASDAVKPEEEEEEEEKSEAEDE